MTSHPHPTAPQGDDDATESTNIEEVFAGLTAIDIIDGELVPRGRRRSR